MIERLVRTEGWYQRLHDYVQDVWFTPFAYGSHDCGLYAGGAIEAMTGVDPAQGLRGRYTTFKGGLKVLKTCGWSSHVDMARHFFPEQLHPSKAQIGDLAALTSADGTGLALGIVAGAHILVTQSGDAGTGCVDLLSAQFVLRVPFE